MYVSVMCMLRCVWLYTYMSCMVVCISGSSSNDYFCGWCW